jgi:hypothetical protein
MTSTTLMYQVKSETFDCEVPQTHGEQEKFKGKGNMKGRVNDK